MHSIDVNRVHFYHFIGVITDSFAQMHFNHLDFNHFVQRFL